MRERLKYSERNWNILEDSNGNSMTENFFKTQIKKLRVFTSILLGCLYNGEVK